MEHTDITELLEVIEHLDSEEELQWIADRVLQAIEWREKELWGWDE